MMICNVLWVKMGANKLEREAKRLVLATMEGRVVCSEKKKVR